MTVSLNGYKVKLDEERSVHVGFDENAKDDNSYYFMFINKGIKTRLRLSEDSFLTIIRLKDEIDALKKCGKLTWQQVTAVVSEMPVETSDQKSIEELKNND